MRPMEVGAGCQRGELMRMRLVTVVCSFARLAPCQWLWEQVSEVMEYSIFSSMPHFADRSLPLFVFCPKRNLAPRHGIRCQERELDLLLMSSVILSG